MLKISEISVVRSMSEISDIFNTFDEIFWYSQKKVSFHFIFFCLREITETNHFKN